MHPAHPPRKNHMLKRCIGLAAGITALTAMSTITSASSGLTIGLAGGPGRAPEVVPGESYTQTILVTGGDTDRDVLVEVLGYKEDPDNGVVPLSSSEDVEIYSARPFITPAETSVHVLAGESRKVDLEVSIPEAVGNGGRYALLRFSTDSENRGSVGVISAIVLPFKFTIKNSELVHTGKINSLTVANPENGKPLSVSVIFENTGNHHYKLAGEARTKKADGATVETFAVNALSPIPQSSSRIQLDLFPNSDLTPGAYSMDVVLRLEDGTMLDQAVTQFEVSDAYVPPPAPSPSNDHEGASSAPQGTASWIPMLGIGGAAFLLGSAGTLLASKRRRVRR